MKDAFTEKELSRMRAGMPPWETMSFACGGWLQFYLFGVAKAIQVTELDKGVKFYGCSAGGLAAAGIVLGGEFDDAIQFCKDYCVPRAYKDISGLFQLSDYVRKCLELNLIPKFKAIPPDTLHIAITKLPLFAAERISSFQSPSDLVETLLASAAAFPFAPLVKIKDSWYIDGGLSDFQPVRDDETVTVSPFYFSDSDIKPSRYVPLWWTFMPPRSKDTIDWLYNLGFEDGVNYIRQRGIPIDDKKLTDILRQRRISHPYNIRKKVR